MKTTTLDPRIESLAAESGAIDRYHELEEWFADRGLDEIATLCASLAAWHRDAYLRLAGTERRIPIETLRASAVPWLGRPARAPREFLKRIASPRHLLELALAAERSEHCAAHLRAAIGKLGPVDWEADIASGGGPALALGGERRRLRPVR